MIWTVIMRDLRLAFRSGGAWLHGLFFFGAFIALSAIALGGSLNVMRPFAPSLIWLAVILAAMLSFPRVFQEDYQDGNLAQFKISGVSLMQITIAKSVSFWILSLVPLLLAIPFAALVFDMPSTTLKATILSLIIASPALIIYGVLSSAILAGRRGGGFLVVLMTTPFIIPIIIFGLGAIDVYPTSGIAALEFRVLIGLSLIAIAVGIPSSTAALNANLE